MDYPTDLFDGVTTALITPFLAEGAVDYEGLRRLVHSQIASGVRGLLALGTTGEAPTLSTDEQARIVELVVAEAGRADGVRVMVGVGTNSTEKTIENARRARDWGADALLIVSPYYNKPSPDGLIAHFVAVAGAVDLPLVVYNIPGRTGVNIPTSVLAQIARHPNVVAVKEASGNIAQMMTVLTEIPHLAVYSGDDALTFPLICLGGRGVISVVSNLLPGPVVEMVTEALAGNVARARQLHYGLLPMFDAAFVESNPGPIKYALSRRGVVGEAMRLPMAPVRPEGKALIDTALSGYPQEAFPSPDEAR